MSGPETLRPGIRFRAEPIAIGFLIREIANQSEVDPVDHTSLRLAADCGHVRIRAAISRFLAFSADSL
jgi:hypothetical protein